MSEDIDKNPKWRVNEIYLTVIFVIKPFMVDKGPLDPKKTSQGLGMTVYAVQVSVVKDCMDLLRKSQ